MPSDETRGLVFVPTGSAAFDFWGGNRKGQNLYANSLLALKADTGERVWHFQAVHHGIWDYDFPAVTNVIDVHIKSLRRKLGEPSPITTGRGSGYRYDPPPA